MLRILSHQCADGQTHMATDEALLAAAPCSSLRTYEWSRPCLSLGYFQDYTTVKKSFSPSCDMVRRITGGGAIYHIHEVTYCLVAKRGTELPQRSEDIFALLHQHILNGLAHEQVNASMNPAQIGDKHYDSDVRCFASPAPHDLMIKQGKLLGSAARQVKDRVLIHGSLKLQSNDWDADTVAGCALSSAKAQDILIDSITKALNTETTASELNDDELALINEYKQARYHNSDWLELRQGPRAAFKSPTHNK